MRYFVKRHYSLLKQISLETAVKSKRNVSLLEAFAFDKLKWEWPDQKTELKDSIAFVLENVLDAYEVPSWSLNSETLGDVNVQLWRLLRPRVETTMNNRFRQPEVHITSRSFQFEERENALVERS
jgi:hypothetical protein